MDKPSLWADSQRSHSLQKVRSYLLSAGAEVEHPRDWRPYILAFSEDPERQGKLLEFARWIEGGSGITTVVRFLTGKGAWLNKKHKEAEETLLKEIRHHRRDVFLRVVAGSDPGASLIAMIQGYGLGPIKANVILVNWIKEQAKDEHERILHYAKYLRSGSRLGCHLVILCDQNKCWDTVIRQLPENRCIDIWWRGDSTSRLMLLLAYLTTRDEEWSEAPIRVLATNYPADTVENREELTAILSETRILAEPILIPHVDTQAVIEYSSKSSLTFLPFTFKKTGPTDLFSNLANELVPYLGVTVLVHAGEDVDLDANPEDGEAGMFARALDAVEQANSRMEKARDEAVVTAARAKKMMDDIDIAGSVFDDPTLKKIKVALSAREKADKASKKLLKENAKFEGLIENLKSQEP